MKRWIVPLMAALLTVGTAQIAAAQGQGQGKGQSQSQGNDQYDDKGKDKDNGKDNGKDAYKGDANRGEVVSECNHRANAKNLKGQDRKDYTEWCESRGARYKYDDKRYSGERNCYQKADNKGLSGSKRANFLDKCFAEHEGKYYGGKVLQKLD
jgi:uncharacterized sporulation protein YeaH/YhbH (DUF444 family)